MTLEEMLALLADTPPGNISAEDMRAIVTNIWDEIGTQAAAAAQAAVQDAVAQAVQTGAGGTIVGGTIRLDGQGPPRDYVVVAWTPAP